MADAEIPQAPKPYTVARKKDTNALAREACERFTECQRQKTIAKLDIEEVYAFAAPDRIRNATETGNRTRTEDKGDLQTSIAFEVIEDFSNMKIDSFMPQAGKWAERRAPAGLSEEQKQQVNQAAKKEDVKVFETIKASNFYAALAMSQIPDSGIGIDAMHIFDHGGYKPVECISLPIRKIEFNIGPDGMVDDRFAVEYTTFSRVTALLPGVSLPSDIEEKCSSSHNEKCAIKWGYWRKWDRRDNEVWQHVILIDDDLIYDREIEGEGSCPLLIGRFGATPDFAWPTGPSIRSLPEFRQVDYTEASFAENFDFTLRPPIAFPDDSVLNLSMGIEPGKAYPKRPGTKGEIEKLYEPNPLQAALFETEKKQRRIRKLHYVDFPDQPGKTPPTATQWLDQMVEAQKKIGTPGMAYWNEFPQQVFKRFLYICEKRGICQPIEIENDQGEKKSLALQAYNPAERAMQNQEVLTATRFLQIAGQGFPQIAQAIIDGIATLKNIKEKLGDELVVLREPDQLKQGLTDLASVAGVRPASPAGLPASQQGPVDAG